MPNDPVPTDLVRTVPVPNDLVPNDLVPNDLVEVSGIEPPTSAVRRQRSTGLSYTPRMRAQA